MSWYGDAISVYPLVTEWRFGVAQSGVYGTRTYLENLGQLTGVTPTNLPRIGAAWDTDYPNLTVKSIDSAYINDNTSCGRKFTVSYDGQPFIQQLQLSSDDLPISVDVGGEFTAFEPYTEESGSGKIYYWNWASDGKGVDKASLFLHKGIANLKRTRVVKQAEVYVLTSLEYIGHVNKGWFFGFPEGMVMFEGCSMFQFKNKMGHDRWKAELNFSIKNVTDKFYYDGDGVDVKTQLNGWNFIVRGDKAGAVARWDMPLDKNGIGLYTAMDFDLLISENNLFEDEDYYNKFPSN